MPLANESLNEPNARHQQSLSRIIPPLDREQLERDLIHTQKIREYTFREDKILRITHDPHEAP
ncbi:MAG: hypothetical protein AAFX50_14930 [Acidobacteriota bacterium]